MSFLRIGREWNAMMNEVEYTENRMYIERVGLQSVKPAVL